MSAPRGPAGQAARRYLLAGLLRCGTCGRRLESSWSNGKPTYRCRHGYASAARPDPARAKNVYVREDQILPHLAALAILLDGRDQAHNRVKQGTAQITVSGQAAELINHLRASGTTLTYDPGTRALRTETRDPVAVTIGQRG